MCTTSAPLRRNVKFRFLPVAQHRQHDRIFTRCFPQHPRSFGLFAIDLDNCIPFLHPGLSRARPLLHVDDQNAAHRQLDPDRISARNQIILRRKYGARAKQHCEQGRREPPHKISCFHHHAIFRLLRTRLIWPLLPRITPPPC